MAAGPISKDMKWRSDSDNFVVIEYDDTYLVYVRSSGETHFLNFLTFGTLQEVVNVPKRFDQLVHDLRIRFDFSEEELTESLVEIAISELDDTGLILPVEDV